MPKNSFNWSLELRNRTLGKNDSKFKLEKNARRFLARQNNEFKPIGRLDVNFASQDTCLKLTSNGRYTVMFSKIQTFDEIYEFMEVYKDVLTIYDNDPAKFGHVVRSHIFDPNTMDEQIYFIFANQSETEIIYNGMTGPTRVDLETFEVMTTCDSTGQPIRSDVRSLYKFRDNTILTWDSPNTLRRIDIKTMQVTYEHKICQDSPRVNWKHRSAPGIVCMDINPFDHSTMAVVTRNKSRKYIKINLHLYDIRQLDSGDRLGKFGRLKDEERLTTVEISAALPKELHMGYPGEVKYSPDGNKIAVGLNPEVSDAFIDIYRVVGNELELITKFDTTRFNFILSWFDCDRIYFGGEVPAELWNVDESYGDLVIEFFPILNFPIEAEYIYIHPTLPLLAQYSPYTDEYQKFRYGLWGL